MVGAVGHGGDLRPGRPLTGRQHLGHARLHRLGPVLVDELDHLRLGLGQGAVDEHGVHVHLFGVAHVAADERPQVLVDHAALDDLERRDVQAFGDDVVGLGAVAAGQETPGVGHVPAELEEAEQLTSVEDGTQERPVGQVAALHQIGIVADDQVAGREVAVEGLDHLAGGVAGREDVAGDIGSRDHDLALGIEPAQAEVAHQGEHVRLGGVQHLLARLVEQALEAVPDHGEGRGVESGFAGGGSQPALRGPRRAPRRRRSSSCLPCHSPFPDRPLMVV